MDRSQDEGFMVGQDGGQPRDAQGRPDISLLKRQHKLRGDNCTTTRIISYFDIC